ncbi:MAG TPA: glycosyltransferase family 39 protein, partial [Candidatus Acidoferrales bacterium]|nr:glycosyltransferase family 39 protein [Candidatus Acidoferrales bacterium]
MTTRATDEPAKSAKASLAWGMPVLLFAGLLVRLVFVPSEGYDVDLHTFEAWAISLATHGLGNFYASGQFADYPPGYFYILAVVGEIWQFLSHVGLGRDIVLKALVKLPAILADLGVGTLLYAIARRFAPQGMALLTAALYLLNPAIVYDSAYWGQIDSVAGGFALLAIFCLLKSDDGEPSSAVDWWIVGGWLAFGYSLLIKPQAAVLAPLMIAFALIDRPRLRRRLVSTAAGMAGALLLAILLSEPFHLSDPVSALAWLFQQFHYGTTVYPYNSVNAFNLWTIRGSMWQSDADPILFFNVVPLGPYWLWGILLTLAAVALVVWR